LDVRQLVRLLRRSTHGERDGWHVVHVPSVAAEDQRHRHRDLATRKQERARTTTRSKGLLRSQGGRLTSLSQLPAPLEAWWLWEGSPLPRGLRRRVRRVYAPPQFLSHQSVEWEAECRARLPTSQEAPSEKVRPLRPLRGLGINGAWL
jgi:transposase